MRITLSLFLFGLLAFFLVACQKDVTAVNKPPVVNAGRDTTFTLNSTTGNNIILVGSAADPEGSVVSFLWSQVSGPSRANLETPGAASTVVNGLVSGQYVFQLMATDDQGAVGSKRVTVTIVQNNRQTGTNVSPVVFAGNDTTFQLISPLRDTIQVSGSATDSDGTVVGYVWSQISGPNNAKILYPGSPSTKVSGVVEGRYVFQLMATDNNGATGVKTVSITVRAPQTVTLSLQPSPNTQERYLAVNYLGDASDITSPEIGGVAWTNGGSGAYVRSLLKFDFSTIPAGAKIISAKLSLYSNPTPLNGNLEDANYGTNNAFLLQRVAENWTSSVKWQTQPAAVSTNQVLVPSTSQSRLDLIDLDVTTLVNDMQQLGNYGFLLKLQSEVAFTSRIFCSSRYADATKHPKLVIQYSN